MFSLEIPWAVRKVMGNIHPALEVTKVIIFVLLYLYFILFAFCIKK
jgi:hypothetical protein